MQGGLLKKLDKSKLTNWTNLDPALLDQIGKLDPGNKYLVDWLWGYTTVAINVDKVKAALGSTPLPENSWELVFNPKYTQKLKSCGVSFLDSPSEVLQSAMVYMGKNPFSKDVSEYNQAYDMLSKVRPYVTLFSSAGYINDMANGSVCVAHGFSGDLNIARQRAIDNKSGQKIEVLIPKTGAYMFFDTMAIPADAPHPNNAHLWINYILKAKVAASLTNKVFYANPNKASLEFIKPDVANNKTIFLSDEDKAKMIAPDAVSNDVRRTMTRLFTRFKTGL
jgi:putrescine transport system substrate-binding protein